jgi:hypothetical protein
MDGGYLSTLQSNVAEQRVATQASAPKYGGEALRGTQAELFEDMRRRLNSVEGNKPFRIKTNQRLDVLNNSGSKKQITHRQVPA